MEHIEEAGILRRLLCVLPPSLSESILGEISRDEGHGQQLASSA